MQEDQERIHASQTPKSFNLFEVEEGQSPPCLALQCRQQHFPPTVRETLCENE